MTHGVVEMRTIQAPEETVTHMYDVFSGKWDKVHVIQNSYLRRIIEANKFMPDDSKFQENIRNYLQSHETDIQKDYIECEDLRMKSDIYDLYKEYHVMKKK